MAGIIRNLEIFGTGTHRASTGPITVTEEDLDQIVEAFDALQGTNIVKPHLKLGHTDTQKFFGQKDGVPSLGWIERVWREGQKLLADITDVPDALLDMIKSRRFHNVSAEVYIDAPIEHEGKKFNRVLKAVSLLGIEMPAVKDLAGLAKALFQTEPIHQFSDGSAVELEPKEPDMPPEKKVESTATFTQEQVDALVAAAVGKAVNETKAEFSAEKADLEKKLEVAENRANQAEGQLKVVKAEAINKEAENLVATAIKEGKLLPKQKDIALAFLTSGDSEVKFGEGTKSMKELFSEFLDAGGKQTDTSEKGAGDVKRTEFSTPADEVNYRANEWLKEHADKTFSDAFDAVLAADEDLRKRYAEGAN